MKPFTGRPCSVNVLCSTGLRLDFLGFSVVVVVVVVVIVVVVVVVVS